MKSIINWIETHNLPNSILYGGTIAVAFAAPYLSRYGMGKVLGLLLVWRFISGLFRKIPAAKQTTFGRADKVLLFATGAFLLVALLDLQFHVVDRIYEFYVLHTLP